MLVRDFMNREVETCEPGDDLAKAAMIMWRKDCGIVPVVEDARQVLGVVTDRDICMAAATRHRAPDQMVVAEVMARRPCAVRPDDDIETALDHMRSERVRRLPVVGQDGRLEGILSIADVLLGLERAGGTASKQLMTTVISTLQNICARVSEPREAHAVHA
jgi:CBS domain-containing protein